MSHSLLKGVYTIIELIKVDTRSLDYSSYEYIDRLSCCSDPQVGNMVQR